MFATWYSARAAPRGHEVVGLERLELDGVRACVGGDVDQLQRQVERPVVIDAGLGDDERPLSHGASSVRWNCLLQQFRGRRQVAQHDD